MMMRTSSAFAAVEVALLGLVLASSCFSPKIDEGAFLCGPAGSCPSGFSCMGSRCYKQSQPRDGAADMGCAQNQRECSPSTGTSGACDPVCQSGCGSCNDKCTNNGAGNVCVPVAQPVAAMYDRCMPDRDSCAPGTVCLGEFNPDKCGAHCYRFCRQDSDCSGPGGNMIARCTGEAQDGNRNILYKHCSPRLENCNPAGTSPRCSPLAAADRAFPAFACYMLSWRHPDEAVCECAGSLPEGAACSREYECTPGNECLQVGSETRCRKLCTPPGSLVTPPVPCGVGQRCMQFAGGTKLGFCLPL